MNTRRSSQNSERSRSPVKEVRSTQKDGEHKSTDRKQRKGSDALRNSTEKKNSSDRCDVESVKIHVPEERISQTTQHTSTGDLSGESTHKHSKMMDFRRTHLNPMMQLHYSNDPVKIVKGEMQYLIDELGNRYLDCVNNVCHVGHCNPAVVERVSRQLSTLNTNSRYLHDEINEYTTKILSTFPPELCVLTIANSGSEANDLAIQMARIHTGNQAIVCVEGAYHGHVETTMKISPYKWAGKMKCPEDTIIVASPCQFRGKFRGADASRKYAEELKLQTQNRQVAAFISEGLQSCAGQVIPPQDYFKEIFEVVRSQGSICIIDEVQSGMGRIGSHFWSFQEYGVIPDIVTFSKAMGNGFPVAGVVCTRAIADSFKNRGINYFNTYGGNPVACAAAHATYDYIKDNNLLEHTQKVGEYLGEELTKLQAKHPEHIGDVRGKGLFYGVDIVHGRGSTKPDAPFADEVCLEAKRRFVFLNTDGIYHNIIKVKPPIVFTKENVDTMIAAIDASIMHLDALAQSASSKTLPQ